MQCVVLFDEGAITTAAFLDASLLPRRSRTSICHLLSGFARRHVAESEDQFLRECLTPANLACGLASATNTGQEGQRSGREWLVEWVGECPEVLYRWFYHDVLPILIKRERERARDMFELWVC